MKKAYIKLFAGLGNQLFQYAYGQYLVQQGYTVRYILNRSSFDLLSVFTLTPQERVTVFAPEGKFKNLFLFLFYLYIITFFVVTENKNYNSKISSFLNKSS